MVNSPMNLNDVGTIEPLGLLAGAHVTPIDHLYFSPIDFQSPRDKYPVYAMADGFIVEVGVRRVNVDMGTAKSPEYRIIMQHSCQTISYFDLVTSLNPSILDQIPALNTSDQANSLHVPIYAGQEIGRIGGQTLDTAVYNMDLELSGYISPELYDNEFWKIHTDDFFAYFDEPLRSQMLAKNLRQAEPRSGKIDLDQPGKLIGNWFEEGTNGYAGIYGSGPAQDGKGYWTTHLAVVPHAIKPEIFLVSLGDYEGFPKQFAIKGNAPDPSTVTKDSGVIKYELVQTPNFRTIDDLNKNQTFAQVFGVVLFQVMDGEKLKVEIFPGKNGSQVNGFSNQAKTYER